MPQPARNPFWIIVIIALGFCGYGAYQWVQVEMPTDPQLKLNVEANYQADIARMRASAPDGQLDLSDDWESKHKQAIREEFITAAQHEKDLARSWFVIGLALFVFSLGRILAQPLFNKDN